MKPLKLVLEMDIEPHIVRNILLVMLFERGKKFRFTKDSVVLNIKSYIKMYGSSYYESDRVKDRYDCNDDYADKLKKADIMIYDLFPEMVDDENNSLRFIKG